MTSSSLRGTNLNLNLLLGKEILKKMREVENTEFLAMEMWTGYHASMVMQHITASKIESGAYPIETALSGSDFYNYALSRNYKIEIKTC